MPHYQIEIKDIRLGDRVGVSGKVTEVQRHGQQVRVRFEMDGTYDFDHSTVVNVFRLYKEGDKRI